MDPVELKTLVEQALADKVLSLDEHKEIIDAVLHDGKISAEEQEILRQLLEKVVSGEVESRDY
uniref:Uncharacterized protein n=1 Tax=Cyanothece sp. (strain PCC 7425 / ATCC 29141) TaxID=395961 RepID=B8HKE1_CYAP4